MEEGHVIANLLANPVYSGIGTWFGTIVSVISALVAFKQAKKAISIVRRLQREQKRNYVEMVHRSIVRLDEVIKPIVMTGLPARGVKISEVVINARTICHQLLSLPVQKILVDTSKAITNIDQNLTQIEGLINRVKNNGATFSTFHDLQQGTLPEIQLLQRSCLVYLDADATAES